MVASVKAPDKLLSFINKLVIKTQLHLLKKYLQDQAISFIAFPSFFKEETPAAKANIKGTVIAPVAPEASIVAKIQV